MKKKIITLLIALLTALPILWAQEMNKPANGDGKEENPYQISSAAELRWFADEVNRGNYSLCAILTQSINLNPGFTFDEHGYYGMGKPIEWKTPIGPISSYGGYRGIFDGKGYIISGLYVKDEHQYESPSSLGTLALFSLIDKDGIIKNLGVENSFLTSTNSIGAICSFNNGAISNCYSTTIVISSRIAGGICSGNSGLIRNCYNMGKIMSHKNGSAVGGICGDNMGIIDNCYNAGYISLSNAGNIGGICGQNGGLTEFESIISNCYNAGTVTGPEQVYVYAGGIVGNGQPKSVIINCYNMGKVTGEESGGIFGISYVGWQNSISSSFYLEGMAEQSIGAGNVDNGLAEVKNVMEIINQMNCSNVFTAENGWKTLANYRNGQLILPSLCNESPPTKRCHTVTASSTSGGAINSLGGVYAEGAIITITATPYEGAKFLYWTNLSGVVVSTEENYTFRVTRDIALTACFDFEIKYYSIYLDSPILESNALSIEGGGSIILNLVPNGNYNIDNMIVEYKRGEHGTWQILEKEEYDIYVVNNILSDIYVKTEGIIHVTNETIANNEIRVYTENEHLFIYTPRLQYVNMISSDGRVVRREKQSGLQRYDGVGQGVYFIQVDNRSFKVMITR